MSAVNDGQSGRSADAAAPRHARPFAALFLATLVVCAMAPLNLWPFSNWELFSRLRTDQETGWEAVAVSRTGRVHEYPIASLPHRYRSVRLTTGEHNVICAAWLRGADERFGPDTRLSKIYRVERLLADRLGERAAPPRRTLAWTCTAKGAREAI